MMIEQIKQTYSNLKLLFLLVLTCAISNAQIAIGTDSPAIGTLLDIQDATNLSGVLLPQVDILDLRTVEPLPSGTEIGTLVYNTNTSSGIGYYFWDGSSWTRSTAYIGQMAKYSNSAAAVTDRNLSTNTNAQLFGVQEFNDNNVLYTSNGNDEIVIHETGVYNITVALSLVGTYGTSGNASTRGRGEIDTRIYVNNNPVGPLYRSTEMNMTSAPGDLSYGSLSFTQPVTINAGQRITVRTGQSTNGSRATVKLRSTRTSTIFLQKIL